MAEEVKPFAEEVVEKTELEKHIERMQNHTIPFKPQMLSLVQTLMENHVKSGNLKLTELDALVFARDEINKAQIDYQGHVERNNKRLQELQAEELENREGLRQKAIADERAKLIEERQERKKYQNKVLELEQEIARLTGLTNTVVEPQEKKEPKRSRAFEMARAMNPVKDEQMQEAHDLMEQEEVQEELDLSIPDDALGTEDFFKEVESVQEEADEKINQELEEKLDDLEQWEEENGHPSNDDIAVMMQDELEEEAEGEEFQVQEEDTETQPNFTKPVISNSQLPEIKTYDSVEDLQAAVDEKNQQQEEEYEEITIPSESELNSMTKAQIKAEADKLGFDKVNEKNTKAVMVEVFISETNEYIKNLQETGEFVSAETTNSSESTSSEDDRQDGGYF